MLYCYSVGLPIHTCSQRYYVRCLYQPLELEGDYIDARYTTQKISMCLFEWAPRRFHLLNTKCVMSVEALLTEHPLYYICLQKIL